MYDLTILVPQENEQTVTGMEKLVGGLGGRILKTNDLGSKRMAYKIQKHDNAHYFSFDVELAADKVKELDAAIRVDDSIIRHLLIKKVTSDKQSFSANKGPASQAKRGEQVTSRENN